MTASRPRAPYLKGDARHQAGVDLKTRYEAGATVRQLADETGRSYGSIAQLLRLAGTQMRPVGWPRKTNALEEES